MGFQGRLTKSVADRLRAGLQLGIAGIACGLWIPMFWTPTPAYAVDCKNAETIIERAICRDTRISALDWQLTQALHELLEARPNERDVILFDERNWIDMRDGRCEPYDGDPAKFHHCLEEAYLARLAVLRGGSSAPPAPTGTGSGAAVCKVLLDRYRPLANRNPGQPPLRVLAQARTAGFELVGSGQDMLDTSSNLMSWAKAQQPPVSISPQLSESLDDSGGVLQQAAPGIPFYMLNRSDGSRLACDSSVFFAVRDGVAVPAPKPLYDDEVACLRSGEFASLGSMPLYTRENYDYRPGMTASLEVATWHTDHFQSACTISLTYLPRVTADTLSPSEERCTGAACDAMRKVAFEFVKSKVTGNLSPESLLSGLTNKQRESYQAEEAAAASQSDGEVPDDVVLVPYVWRGNVYVVGIADRAIGSSVYADQSVQFEQLEDGRIVERAAFTVGVWKGELKEVTIDSAP